MGLTEEQRKNNMKTMTIYIGICITTILVYLFGYTSYLSFEEGVPPLQGLFLVIEKIQDFSFFYPINLHSIIGFLIGILVGAFIIFLLLIDNVRNYAYKYDEVAGTGGFMTQKELKEYSEKYIYPDPAPVKDNLPVPYNNETDKDKYSKNMIMSQNFSRPIDAYIIGNNNVLVIGGSGSGKSRYFVKPNLLQMNASYIITDPKGEMLNDVGKVLKDHGYRIKVFNITDMGHSNCYNPLHYIRDEAGVNMVIETLINNTTKGSGGGDNQFFVDAEKLLYSACIFYLLDFCHDDSKKNFESILNMINSSSINEQDPNAKSPLDMLFDKCPYNSLARKFYRSFKQAAGKTLKSIIISCVTRLQYFMTPQVANLTRVDDLDLKSIGDEKTALFIITPAADRTYSFLASILYSQLFETLYFYGEQRKAIYGSEKMPIPIRCMMDEFANIGEIPEFPSKLATMRSYNISACVILQDIAQIEKMYKDDWKTLVGNCSSIIFLGTKEPNTCKYFSEMLGPMTIQQRSRGVSKGGKGGSNKNFQSTKRDVMTPEEVSRMKEKECLVFTYTFRPVFDKKYDYNSHPYFKQTADYDDSYAFKYKEMSVFDNTRQDYVESIIKAQSEAKRYRERQEEKKGKEFGVEKTNESTIYGNVDEEINNIEINNKELEKQAYNSLLQKCQLEATEFYGDAVCIIKLKDIPSKYLFKLIDQVSASLQKTPMIIFTDVSIDKKTNFMVGIGLDRNNEGLKEAMNNSFSQGVDEENGYVITAINKNCFNEYKKEVLNKFVNKEQE